MEDCIFCKIIGGEIPSKKVYEDDKYIAFLDIRPFSMGHVLVLPKAHHSNIHEIPDELLSNMMPIVKKIAKKIEKELHPKGIVINQNNGESAGQSVMHFHIHIKPIYEDTQYDIAECRTKPSEAELNRIQTLLSIS